MMKDDDFKLLRGFDNKLTDGRIVIVESLSRLKILHGHDSKFSQIAMIFLLSVSKTSSLS